MSTNAYISTSRQPLPASRSVAIVFSDAVRDSFAIAVEIVASFNPQEVQNLCCSAFSFPHLGQYMNSASSFIDQQENWARHIGQQRFGCYRRAGYWPRPRFLLRTLLARGSNPL